MAFNFNSSTKSYNYTPKDDPKDRVEVEIGDSKEPDIILPQVKIMRWDKLKIGLSYWFNLSSIKKAVVDAVLPAFREKIKVFNSVVSFNFVDMMDNLGFGKVTTKMFFHYKSVFRNIILFVVKWMAGTFNKTITFTIKLNSTFPVVVVFPRIIANFSFVPRSITLSEFTHRLSITVNNKLSNPYR